MEGQVVRSGIFLRNGWTFGNLNEIRTELDYFQCVGKIVIPLATILQDA